MKASSHHSVAHLLLIIVALTLNGCAGAQKKRETEQQLKKLAIESAESHESCEKYVSELEKGSGLKGRPSVAEFKDKKVALSVLRKLEEHPLTPKATSEFGQVLIQQDGDALNFASFPDSLSLVQGFCGTVPTYINFVRLVLGKSKFKWTDLELARIKRVGLKWVEAESSFPGSLLNTKVAVSVMETMNEADFFSNQIKVREKIDTLKTESQMISDELRQKSAHSEISTSKDSAKLKVLELRETAKIRSQLRTLYIEVI